jgi:hypothetical protein
MTWIALVRGKRKSIVRRIGRGDGRAMVSPGDDSRRQDLIYDSGVRRKSQGEHNFSVITSAAYVD